jgi:hypothetical protein
MPFAPPRACLEPRCPRYAIKRGRCDEHQKEHEKQLYQDRNVTDPFHAQYQTVQWHRLSKSFKAQNPLCLFIEENGVQCRYKSDLVHHRIAAKERPDLFLDPKNLAALCNHHHGHTSGDAAGVRYVPAVYINSLLPGQNLAEPNYSTAPPPPKK